MSDAWSFTCNICPGGGGQAGVGGNGSSTNNWWATRNAAAAPEPVLTGIRCAWCHLWLDGRPFNHTPNAYRPMATSTAWEAGFRYPPRIPGAPGNAGATPID